MAAWIILIVSAGWVAFSLFKGGKKKMKPADKKRYYLQDIFINVCILLAVFLMNPAIYLPLDFSILGRGVSLGDNFVSNAISIFIFPLLFSFTPWVSYPKNIETATELFGFPIFLVPDNAWELALFFVFLVVGVVFEELYFRQILFYTLYETLHFQGDVILLVTAAVFALGHWYQGIGGLISSFVVGLILGKVYQYTGNILYPIALHLTSNMTIILLSIRRMRDLKRPIT